MSSSSDWNRAQGLFEAAGRLAPDERAAFLELECGDDRGLLEEVRSLLAADGDTREFLEPPSPDTLRRLAAVDSESLRPGTRVGPYRVERLIASGGMGDVYLARDTSAKDLALVAVKVLRGGAVSAEMEARFRRERDTLQRLEHEGIARMLASGTTEEGLAYLVMEYVDGIPVTRHCDEQRLSVGQRLEMFLSICASVQYAHQSLIVHRDIKPSNVLVDQSGRPHLLDFGIAKPLPGPQEAVTAGLTQTGGQPMTPGYASPEQIRGRAVTTATDVYSLGVLLYELLTGQLPHSVEQSAYELERSICERDARRPSAVAASADGAAAARRGTSPARLARALVGDLDGIVAMALRKEPDKRYASVAQLAGDVRRHIEHLPVFAHEGTWRYRVGRFVRRHPRESLVGALLALSLFGGVAAFSWQARVAKAMARAADDERAKVVQWADVGRLERLEQDAQRLWPAVPARLSEYDGWLRRADGVARRRGGYEAALDELRRGAGARIRGPRPADERELEDLLAVRETLLAKMQSSSTGAEEADTLIAIEARIETLEEELDESVTWRFEHAEDGRKHETLVRLLAAYAALEPRVADIERRRALAARIERRLREDDAQAWRRARADVAALPVYAGLELVPQDGLVPLGRDRASGLWEFADLQTGVPATWGDDGAVVDGASGVVFVLLPGATFVMGADPPSFERPPGSPNVDPRAVGDEGPAHEITLDAFFLAKHEMTQAQWERWCGNNPSFIREGPTRPVETISWYLASATLEQLGWQLPTEAQWEYAARAGTTTIWPTGESKESLAGFANIVDVSAAHTSWASELVEYPEFSDGYSQHAPVDSLSPNAAGLYHMIGNVSELCRDPFVSYRVPVWPGSGLRIVVAKETPTRVVRGGSFARGVVKARSAQRNQLIGHGVSSNIGVRPARALTH